MKNSKHNSKITGKNIYKHTLLHPDSDGQRCKKNRLLMKTHKQVIQKKRNKMSTLQSFPKGKYAALSVKWK